ncbi:MAG: hypothetical protein IT270_05480 [Saprospiraceae bacterium]|nr:hypothetical protein [Saprospiraceae bacterium]
MKNAIVLLVCVLIFAQCSQPETQDSQVTSKEAVSAPISTDSATMAIMDYDRYKTRVDSVLTVGRDAADAGVLAQGFKLPKGEVAAMAARIARSSYDSVYAMLAIRYDKNNQPYMTVIFQEYTGSATAPSWTFYDYSRPCPPNCPTDK